MLLFIGGSRGGTGVPDPLPLENHRNIGFPSNIDPDSLKILQSYQASIQCWVIMGPPAKRYSMAFYWRTDDGPFIVMFGNSIPHQLKKKKLIELGPPLTLSGSAHVLVSI